VQLGELARISLRGAIAISSVVSLPACAAARGG
jgi:hypothetical protein